MTANSEENQPVWIYPKRDKEEEERLVKEFSIHPVTAQIFITRGFSSREEIYKYLYAKLPDLHDPLLLAEMDLAIERVIRALTANENILIYGDNDVDGMTGTALLVEFLTFMGGNVYYFLSTPGASRDNLIVEALGYAKKHECTLLITVDCGITSATEIENIASHGIDVIVTDHHEPTEKIPHCVATLNPKLYSSEYPNRDLTGVGVAFKLAHAVTNRLVHQGVLSPDKIDLKRYLDLVALGTIADMGQLLGENRIMVQYGIRQLRKSKRVGLFKLIAVADLKPNQITSFTIASKIAPRLNSLGRIADPKKGVDLLLIRNGVEAEKMAHELDDNNLLRREIERAMSESVDEMIAMEPSMLENKAIVLCSHEWHPGVIAILSNRISKRYSRPTVMIAIENGMGKGSLRSIRQFPLLGALKECRDLLQNFGGHDFAAGLTLKEENIELFKKRFIDKANQCLTNEDVRSKLQLDAEVTFDEITYDLIESLKLLEPYGNENQQPVLYARVRQTWLPKVFGGSHLKLFLAQGERVLEGLAFGKADLLPQLKRKDIELEVAFFPQVNNYLGPTIQLLIREIRIVK